LIYKPKEIKFFGVPYEDLMTDNNSDGIPWLIKDSIHLIEESGLETEHIFRTTPNKSTLDAFRARIDSRKLTSISEIPSIHIVAGILKMFLSLLPEPIFTYENYTKFLDTTDITDEGERINFIKNLLQQIPAINLKLISKLMELCSKLSQFSSKNNMNAQNLAAVFSPLMLYDRQPDPIFAIDNLEKSIRVLTVLIQNYQSIFAS